MAAITVSELLEDGSNPPTGIIETEDTITVVMALDSCNVFISMEALMRPMMVETLELALAALKGQSTEVATAPVPVAAPAASSELDGF